jgi:hypothetical protein
MENNVALRYGEPVSIKKTVIHIPAHDRQLQRVQPLEAQEDLNTSAISTISAAASTTNHQKQFQ